MPLLTLHSIPPSSPALLSKPLSSPFLPRKRALPISSWQHTTFAHSSRQQQDGLHSALSPRMPFLAGLELTRCVEQRSLEPRLISDTILARFLLPKAGALNKVFNLGEQLENTEEAGRNHERWTNFLLSFLRVSRILPFFFLAVAVVLNSRSPAIAVSEGGPSVVAAAKATNDIQVLHLFASGWTGLMAGCLHALTGLDHLAALAPLCMGRAKLESAAIGALWGCGHDAGQVLFGLVFLLLKDKLHIELVRTWAARIVGVTLLSIGVLGIKEAQELPVAVLAGAGGINAELGEAANGRKNDRKLRTFATGLVYGLQPDALFMVLPALALPSRLAGAAYLAMFLLGTVIAMASYTAFIGSCGEALQKRLPWIARRLSIGSSLIAMAFGIGVLLGEFLGINFF